MNAMLLTAQAAQRSKDTCIIHQGAAKPKAPQRPTDRNWLAGYASHTSVGCRSHKSDRYRSQRRDG
jgi:hypothetical protein